MAEAFGRSASHIGGATARVCRPATRVKTPSKPRKGRCAGRPDRNFGERLTRLGKETEEDDAQSTAGVLAAARAPGKRPQHGKPQKAWSGMTTRRPVRERLGAPVGVAESAFPGR